MPVSLPPKPSLAGPVIQSDQVYFQVYASQPYLLRGVTRDIYTGRSWQSSSRQVYRLDSPLWWLVKRQVFAEGQPSGADGLAFAAAFRQNVQIGVNPQTWRQSSLFTVGQVGRIVWNQENPPPVYFTGDGDLFVFDGFSGSQEYALTTAVWNRGQPGFAQALAEMAAQPERARDPYWPGIRDQYLQVPEELPDLVSATARLVAADAENPYEQALLLETYLQTRFTYSLKAELPPGDMDFVAYFLQSRTGYCVHFATAITIMARTLGIPARYVEGFALEPGKAAGVFSWLRARRPTPWTELYFRGIGWLTFDPTATDRPDPTDEPTDPNQETPTPAPSPTPAPTPPPAGPEDTPRKIGQPALAVHPGRRRSAGGLPAPAGSGPGKNAISAACSRRRSACAGRARRSAWKRFTRICCISWHAWTCSRRPAKRCSNLPKGRKSICA